MKKGLKYIIIYFVVFGILFILAWRHRVNKIDDFMIDVIESVRTSKILNSKYGNIKKVKQIKKSDMSYKNIGCIVFLIKTDKIEEKICTLGHHGISDERYRLDAIKIDDKLYEFFEPFNYSDYQSYIDAYNGEKIKIDYEDYVDIYQKIKKDLNLSGELKVDIKFDKETLAYYFKIEKWSYNMKTKEEKLVESYNIIINNEGIVETIWN